AEIELRDVEDLELDSLHETASGRTTTTTATSEAAGGGGASRLWCICDGCGIICVSVTYTLLICANFVVVKLGKWPLGAMGTAASLGLYELWFLLSIWSHLTCMLTDPGACPFDAEAEEGDRRCNKCKAPKPPSAHHCSVCERCILKMDHHCPWMNNCIGAWNQKHFMLFLLYVALQCWAAVISLCGYFLDAAGSDGPKPPRIPGGGFLAQDDAARAEWRREKRKWQETQVSNEGEILCCVMIFFVAIIFGLFTSVMFVDQLSNISSNQTGIDRLQESQSGKERPFRDSMQEVMGRGPLWRWFVPTALRRSQENSK
ncbi:unnamed protein product, partial [Polarella glacialis]